MKVSYPAHRAGHSGDNFIKGTSFVRIKALELKEMIADDRANAVIDQRFNPFLGRDNNGAAM
jgi:hypothetical protein